MKLQTWMEETLLAGPGATERAILQTVCYWRDSD